MVIPRLEKRMKTGRFFFCVSVMCGYDFVQAVRLYVDGDRLFTNYF